MNADSSNRNPECTALGDELAALVFGELDPARVAVIESHLVHCATCRDERALLQKSVELLKHEGQKSGAGATASLLALSADRRAALANEALVAAGSARPKRKPLGQLFTFGRLSAAAGLLLSLSVAGDWLWRKFDADQGRGMRGVSLRVDRDSLGDEVAMARRPVGATARDLKSLGYLGGSNGEEDGDASGTAGDAPAPDATAGYVPGLVGYDLPDATVPSTGGMHAVTSSVSGDSARWVGGDRDGSMPTAGAGIPDDPNAARVRVVVRDEDGNVIPGAEAWLFKGNTPLDSAEKLVGGGMVGIKFPALDPAGTAAPKPAGSPEAAPDSLSVLTAGQPAGPGATPMSLDGGAAGKAGGDGGGTGQPSAYASRRLGAASAKKAGAGEGRAAQKQKDGESLSAAEMKTLKEARNKMRGLAAPTAPAPEAEQLARLEEEQKQVAGAEPIELSQDDRHALEKLGYAVGNGPTMPVPSVGGCAQSQSTFFDDGTSAAEWTRVDPSQLAQWLADSNSPSEVVALLPRVRSALAFDPNTPAASDDQRSHDVVKELMTRLAPRQGETPRDMFFRYFGDHPFVATAQDRFSTFGMDVDSASYNLVRAYHTQGNLPPKAAVSTEEFVNAFKHDFAPPSAAATDAGGDIFAIHTELAPSPFGAPGSYLLQIGLKAREISKEQRRPVALTFVIDTSGSMEQDGRLELVKQSLHLLIDQLDERDTLGVIAFSTDGRRVLAPTNAGNRDKIFAALDTLRPEGSTNADAGLRLGYDMALEQLRAGGENRVILCSDGVANTGVTDPKWLAARIQECKAKNLYLNCVGVGMGNHNDALMEQLADEGDGFCSYLDRIDEARELFVDKLSGTLTTVAKNAKIQVEFDPQAVRRFRQLGYENRAIADRDFRNDRVDAGEVGAGQEVVALYEIELLPSAAGPLATARVRYEEPRAATIHEQAKPLFVSDLATTVAATTPRFRLSAAVAEFAELLRQSIHARDGSLGAIEALTEPLVAELPNDSDVPEFLALVKQAARLPDLLPRRNDVTRCLDELKRSRCLEQEFRGSDAAKEQANGDLLRQLEEQNRKLEQALRDALDNAARATPPGATPGR